MHNVHCSTIHNSQDMEATYYKCPLTDEWIKKMWYVYTMEYYSAIKKAWNSAICSTVGGPRDYHTKWSQSEKDKYQMISLICGI